MTVTALLVSHDGSRWLPAVLDGLAAQRRRPDRVLAVDTGSNDGCLDLLRDSLGPDAVLSHPGSFPEAVDHALPHVPTDWVWLLHDDANPDPGALEALLEAAEATGADVLGPKLREWPSLRRLLEVGITISGTGRRETGLELGEYDQGQHDAVRRVLAVNTAGMLVRREVLEELDGFDPQLPLYGNDLDFGWRAARAGYRTVAVPDAIVFHAEAAHRGLRRTRLLGRRTRTHRAEREAALYTLLANASSRALPWQVLRLFLGTLLRFLGYLLARSPGHAGDEIAALVNVYRRPDRIREARRRRRIQHGDQPPDVRELLAPWWLPYRHGLDFLDDLATAAANQGREAAERRRVARAEESGVVLERSDEEEFPQDTGLLARFLTSPVALTLTAFALLCVWGAREAFGHLSGGALSPTPATDNDWWRLLIEGWHQLGQGTDAPAPGYLLPLAAMASVLLGKPAVAISVLLLLAVPVAAWGAWRFLLVAAELGAAQEHTRLLVGWGAAAYAAVPVASGAWSQGRFGIVASAALLPWLAHAAIGLADPAEERRWRAAWRTGLLLTLITAFTPTAWVVAVVLVGVVVGTASRVAPDLLRSRSVWMPLGLPVVLPPVLLLPGAIGVLGHDLSAILLEAGRLAPTPGALDVVSGRLGDPAAPLWAGLLLVVPAIAALVRPRTRIVVTACWLVVALAAVLAAVLSHVTVDLPAGEARPGLGFLVVVVQGALITAVVTAGHGFFADLTGAGPVWRRPLAAGLAACAVLVPLVGLGWWFVTGDDQLDRPHDELPAYMTQAAEAAPGRGVLILRGSVANGLTWSVYRGDGVTLGEDEVLALSAPDAGVNDDVAALVSRPTPRVVSDLARQGIQYVVMPSPADADAAATLDAAAGLTQASAGDRDLRAWQVDKVAPADAVSGDGPWWHPVLIVLQGLAFLAVLVLCGPTRIVPTPQEEQ